AGMSSAEEVGDIREELRLAARQAVASDPLLRGRRYHSQAEAYTEFSFEELVLHVHQLYAADGDSHPGDSRCKRSRITSCSTTSSLDTVDNFQPDPPVKSPPEGSAISGDEGGDGDDDYAGGILDLARAMWIHAC
ncbi:unnamed protein product, partial [Polarella glacialis]